MSAAATAWLGAALLLMASIYVGAGFSLVFFQFPGAGSITAASYDERMGAQVRRATLTFTFQSLLMVVGGVVLTVAEWDQGRYRYGPLAYTVLTVIATSFFLPIYPINQRMRKEPGPDEFRRLLGVWMRLNTVRLGIWFGEWVAMASWFVGLATRARR
jgi:hypothetical protein